MFRHDQYNVGKKEASLETVTNTVPRTGWPDLTWILTLSKSHFPHQTTSSMGGSSLRDFEGSHLYIQIVIVISIFYALLPLQVARQIVVRWYSGEREGTLGQHWLLKQFCLNHPVEHIQKPKLPKLFVKVETSNTYFIIHNQFVKNCSLSDQLFCSIFLQSPSRQQSYQIMDCKW